MRRKGEFLTFIRSKRDYREYLELLSYVLHATTGNIPNVKSYTLRKKLLTAVGLLSTGI
jgi:hypothetical protein